MFGISTFLPSSHLFLHLVPISACVDSSWFHLFFSLYSSLPHYYFEFFFFLKLIPLFSSPPPRFLCPWPWWVPRWSRHNRCSRSSSSRCSPPSSSKPCSSSSRLWCCSRYKGRLKKSRKHKPGRARRDAPGVAAAGMPTLEAQLNNIQSFITASCRVVMFLRDIVWGVLPWSTHYPPHRPESLLWPCNTAWSHSCQLSTVSLTRLPRGIWNWCACSCHL